MRASAQPQPQTPAGSSREDVGPAISWKSLEGGDKLESPSWALCALWLDLLTLASLLCTWSQTGQLGL